MLILLLYCCYSYRLIWILLYCVCYSYFSCHNLIIYSLWIVMCSFVIFLFLILLLVYCCESLSSHCVCVCLLCYIIIDVLCWLFTSCYNIYYHIILPLLISLCCSSVLYLFVLLYAYFTVFVGNLIVIIMCCVWIVFDCYDLIILILVVFCYYIYIVNTSLLLLL